jgi:hypothetical protein
MGESVRELVEGVFRAVEIATHHVLPNGKPLQFPQAFFVDIRDGFITRLQAYEPYGPHGNAGLILRITRLVRAATGRSD